jgi:hypothetical protein
LDAILNYLIENKELANAIATATSAAIAAFALIVSLISAYVAFAALRHQRKHNILSVTPIPEVTVADYEDSLRVKLANHGSGPMIIIDVTIGDGARAQETLLAWMPPLPDGHYWTNYAGNVSGRSVLPGRDIVLLHLDGDAEDRGFSIARDKCRQVLSRLTIDVRYTDVYRTPMHPYRKALAWFGRHLESEGSADPQGPVTAPQAAT